MLLIYLFFFFFFNDTATTEIYTLSLHDALPIFSEVDKKVIYEVYKRLRPYDGQVDDRSEEHTSELQSRSDLVCRLLLEKKKKTKKKQQNKRNQKRKTHIHRVDKRGKIEST